MDIVHKFLNRDVEQEQLKDTVQDAESKLEGLREQFLAFKRDTEGLALDDGREDEGAPGDIYKEVERHEQILNDAMRRHDMCRTRLQRTTLQVEHMKRWIERVGRLLSHFEEPCKVDQPQDMPLFFQRLSVMLEKFLAHVTNQVQEGRLKPDVMLEEERKLHSAQGRLLKDAQFVSNNTRWRNIQDPGPAGQGSEEDDPAKVLAGDRDRCKQESADLMRQAEYQKRRPKT
jgi:hypothetical protein